MRVQAEMLHSIHSTYIGHTRYRDEVPMTEEFTITHRCRISSDNLSPIEIQRLN